jgi:chromosome segregation ATPase
MDVLSLISEWWGLVGSVISAVAGGGLVSAYNAYRTGNRKAEEAEHTQAMEWSERLEDRLSSVEGRLDAAEKELRNTRKQLTQSRIRRQELSAAIDALIERIDKLIGRLAKHEQITERERDQLTSVPFVDSSNDRAPE